MGIFNFLKKKDGLVKSWYPNGQLEYEFNYKEGKRDGLQKGWFESGQLKREVNYKDGKEDGLKKGWYENGQLWYETNFKDGKRDGLTKSWDEDGQLQLETHHKDGKQAHLRGSEVSALKAEGKAKTKGNLFISLLVAFLTLIIVAIATEGSDEPFVKIMPAVASYLVFRLIRNKTF